MYGSGVRHDERNHVTELRSGYDLSLGLDELDPQLVDTLPDPEDASHHQNEGLAVHIAGEFCPRESRVSNENRLAVARFRTRATTPRNAMRKAMARSCPSWIAFLRSPLGSMFAMIVMMIRLSAPKAIWMRGHAEERGPHRGRLASSASDLRLDLRDVGR
jgi:hypothetical protein